MKVLFVAGVGPIGRDLEVSARFYRDALGAAAECDYVATAALTSVSIRLGR